MVEAAKLLPAWCGVAATRGGGVSPLPPAVKIPFGYFNRGHPTPWWAGAMPPPIMVYLPKVDRACFLYPPPPYYVGRRGV